MRRCIADEAAWSSGSANSKRSALVTEPVRQSFMPTAIAHDIGCVLPDAA